MTSIKDKFNLPNGEEGITFEQMDKLIQWAKEHQLPKTKIGDKYYYKWPGEGPMVKINEDIED